MWCDGEILIRVGGRRNGDDLEALVGSDRASGEAAWSLKDVVIVEFVNASGVLDDEAILLMIHTEPLDEDLISRVFGPLHARGGNWGSGFKF